MRATLKSVMSPDMNLETETPSDVTNFSILVECSIGPVGETGEELFNFEVCTPKHLEESIKREKYLWGKGKLIIESYDYKKIHQAVEDLCARVEGDNWSEVATKLSRLTNWEFEDYQEFKEIA